MKNWLKDSMLMRTQGFVWGKDIVEKVFNSTSEFPIDGEFHIIYCVKGYMEVPSSRYIWGELDGKMQYLEVVEAATITAH